MGNIFICYRREDSQFITDRIFDHLTRRFPRKSLFKDVDDIPPGVDFRTYIDNAVQRSAVVLAIIGPGWLSAKDAAGQRRLDDPNDFVCAELSSALRLQRSIIPVLVGGARMPAAIELPAALQPLANINAVQVRSDPDFKGDFARLQRALERVAGRRHSSWIAPMTIAALALGSIVAIVWYAVGPPLWSPSPPTPATAPSPPTPATAPPSPPGARVTPGQPTDRVDSPALPAVEFILERLCLPNGTPDPTGSRAKALVKVYQQYLYQGSPLGTGVTGLLTTPEIAELMKQAACPMERARNYYEAREFADGIKSPAVITLLNKVLPSGRKLQFDATEADVRARIPEARNAVRAGLQLQDPELSNQLTLDFVTALTNWK